MYISGFTLPMHQYQVEEELDEIQWKLAQTYQSQMFQRNIQKLEKLRDKLEIQEQELYKIFNVRDSKQLQDVMTNKCKGLFSLSSNVLSNLLDTLPANETEKILFEQLNDPNFFDLNEFIRQYPDKPLYELENLAIQIVIDELNKKLSNSRFIDTSKQRTTSKRGMRRIMEVVQDDLGNYIFQKARGQKIYSSFRKKIEEAINAGKVSGNSTEAQLKVAISMRNIYGGYNYTEADIKDDIELQKDIRNRIRIQIDNWLIDHHASREEISAFNEALENIPVSALLKKDKAGIIGILGEIQLMAILKLLAPGTDPIHTGFMRNLLQKNQEVSFDVLLAGYGFQVKNYNEFAFGQGGKFIDIKRSASTPYMFDLLNIDQATREILEHFYGIYHFNQTYTEYFEPTRERIENIYSTLDQFYAQYPEQILRLEETVVNPEYLVEQQKVFYNTFFMVSGKYLMPSSQLLTNVINFLRDMDSNISNVSSSFHSSAKDIRDYIHYKHDANTHKPRVSEVIDNSTLSLQYRIYLPDLTKQY